MSDDELKRYVDAIRLRRTSQTLINENKPTSASKSIRARLDAQVRSLLE